jgi:hypothetical protein
MVSPQATVDAKKGPNLQNYKIVKCKYWEKDGTCRYGTLCTFAHGDTEIRSKTDNLLLNQQGMGYYDMGNMGFPGQPMNYMDPNMMPMMNPYLMGFDPNMMNPAMMMGMPGFDPNMINPMTGLPYTQQPPQGGNSNNGNN